VFKLPLLQRDIRAEAFYFRGENGGRSAMLTVCCPLTREDPVTTHFIGSRNITVALSPPDAMTLFTPEGERSWAGQDGWNPQYPIPSRTSGAGAVFTTQNQGRPTIWVIVDHEPDRIRYARITPHGLAGTVEVRALSGSHADTTVRVTYDLTALTDAAIGELAGFAAGYDAEIDTWASDIAESLARRGTAPRSS
jgi:hypothetical protein